MVRVSRTMRALAEIHCAVAYGNEASVDTAYASYALFIKVEREPKD